MRLPRAKVRDLLLLVALTGLLIWAGFHWIRGDQYAFNVAVSQTVPRQSTLVRLESVIGPGHRPAPSDRLAVSMRRMVESHPAQYPDGWQKGDHWVCYDFPGGHRWWFQVRDGRLVNYDPAILASQPQQVLSTGIR